MKYKITENLVPGGLGMHSTRSRVVDIPEDESVPDGAVKTDEAVRDWQVDEAQASTTGEN